MGKDCIHSSKAQLCRFQDHCQVVGCALYKVPISLSIAPAPLLPRTQASAKHLQSVQSIEAFSNFVPSHSDFRRERNYFRDPYRE